MKLLKALGKGIILLMVITIVSLVVFMLRHSSTTVALSALAICVLGILTACFYYVE